MLLLGAAGMTRGLAQVPAAAQVTPNLVSNIDHPLRYHPDGEDFVITNGNEFFNRPLYGGNTAFRVDAGDQPEFALYLPGRGGNLRLGLRTPAGSKWLHQAAAIEARYRPGEMLYEIRDPLLGNTGVLRVAAIALADAEALAVRVELVGVPSGVELIAAYGGASGQRGRRDGDIGTESVPISQWFQVTPEACRDNEFQIEGSDLVVRHKAVHVRATFPADAVLGLAKATSWGSCADLWAGRGAPHDLIVGVAAMKLAAGTPVYLGVQGIGTGAPAPELETYREVSAAPDAGHPLVPATIIARDDWPRRFAAAEEYFAALRDHVRVVTPDPWINAAAGALNIAADAVWDEPQRAIMHGAVAWRTKLPGWRGPYALDALGWTERARANFTFWLGRQNKSPVPATLPPADAASNLARREAALHSNGDLSNSHYDMNLVFIDALLRHLLWTGDKDFARLSWPVIERHLAWERRLFRREFTANGENLPLYEAYAAIWASDDLQYSGGGTAHASAYNYWHNRMAARLAPLAGASPAPYAQEADLIARGMRALLWTNGHFAESKDWLGRQLVHPSAGLWSFYHTMDSALPNAEEAAGMADEVLRRTSIPVRGPGAPDDRAYAVLPSTDWLPYTWSLNNVVMGENVHTALGLWQGGRAEEAFRLLKSSLLASMFMGISPGNLGSMNYLDVYRRESQRDFADGSGVLSRALVEGLFGVRPDALAGELTIRPGFPADWTRAQLDHPLVRVAFQRTNEGKSETDIYRIADPQGKWPRLRMILPAHKHGVAVRVNGRDAALTFAGDAGHLTSLEFVAPLAGEAVIEVEWDEPRVLLTADSLARRPEMRREHAPEPSATYRALDLTPVLHDQVTEIFRPSKYLSPRSPFVSLALPSQGIGYWAGHVNASAEIDDTGLRATAAAHGGKITLPNGVTFATPGPGTAPNILFASQWDNYPHEATIPLAGKARCVHLLMAGSTNAMQSRLDNGEVIVTYTDGTSSRLALRNPETWWPIEQDYFTDDYQFRIDGPLPTRVDLKTGAVRVLDADAFKGRGGIVAGGAATVLALDLDDGKELKSLTVRALANDVVIGLMAATLER